MSICDRLAARHQRVVGVDAQIDLRLLAVELGQARHQPFLQESGHHADVQHPLRAVLADALHRLAQFSEAALHAGQQPAAGFRQRDLAALAVEQGLVEPLLESADLGADSGRADMQSLCTLGKAQAAGHGLESTQCIERNRVHDS